MFKKMTLVCALMFSVVSQANITDDYLTIKNVEVSEIGRSSGTSLVFENQNTANLDFDAIIMAIDSLIAIGKKVWPIIEAGKPVLNTDGLLLSLSVLPENDLSPRATLTEMANWSIPEVVSYKVEYKNKLGGTIASFVCNTYFQYNGSYNGKGKYLTSITTEASSVWAAWGFNLDVKSELTNIANVGSRENPVASAIVKISLVVNGKINSVHNSYSLYLDGNGNFKALK